MERYNALNLRQSPNLRLALADAFENNTVLLGVVIGIASVASTKVVAATHADWAWIDAEHTPYSPTLLVEMGRRMIPVVRVPSHSHEWISWILDAGAGGVIIPHTETPEQVQASVHAARFPPQGHRSFPPFALLLGLQDAAPEGKTWIDVANEHVAVIPQIESRLGVENLEGIMQVEGVDAIMIGPSDLHLDLGSDTMFTAAMERIHELSKKYKIPLVGFVYENTLTEKYKCGYRMLASAADMWILANGIEKSLETGRELIEEARKEMIGDAEVRNPMC